LKKSFTRAMTAAMLVLSMLGMAATVADARRGGSFGSRGARTYSVPRQTYNSPRQVGAVERSMTSRTQAQQPNPSYSPGFGQNQAARQSGFGSRFGGFGGGLIGGLLAGGLIGHFFGAGGSSGWGSGGAASGMLLALIQIAVIGGLIWLALRFLRRRQQPDTSPSTRTGFGGFNAPPQPNASPWGGGSAQPRTAQPAYSQPASQGNDIPITREDQQAFERLLVDVQDAFGREDYATLRQITTPEIMSYLSEELSQNATQGLRNEVSGTRLLDAEVSEAWSEAGGEYATIAMRYESRDVMRNRATGALASGARDDVSETLEYWTFLRGVEGQWKLSAIQEA
jgi:predicted lipid-binding transport protein (Tim44 family)